MTVNPKELKRVLNSLASTNPAFAYQTLRTKDVDELMLATGGTLIARGMLYNIVCKRLSPGVHKVSLELAN